MLRAALAVCTLAAVVCMSHAATLLPVVTVMGRHRVDAGLGQLQFDNNGVVLAVNFTGVVNVSVRLGAVHTNGVHPPARRAGRSRTPELGCAFGPVTLPPNVPTDELPWEPHMFEAAIFDADAHSLSPTPPPLSGALRRVNFTTVDWAPGKLASRPLFDGLDASRAYAVYVIKVTEPDWNLAFFGPNYAFTAANASDVFDLVGPAAPPSIPFATEDLSARRMEFWGDSLTAGYCNLCQSPNTYAGETYAKTWSFLAAQRFDARLHTVAWSGFGVVRNCNGGDVTMPTVVQRTLATVDAEDWTWDRYLPDVLVVDLGANDHLDAYHPGPLERQWVHDYMAMVNTTVVQRYAARTAPGSTPLHVVLSCGPNGPHWEVSWCPYVMSAVAALQAVADAMPVAARPSVRYHFFNFEIPAPDHCCGHPDVAGDALMADALVSFVSNVTGWDTR